LRFCAAMPCEMRPFFSALAIRNGVSVQVSKMGR
jgi:hypothetical protein